MYFSIQKHLKGKYMKNCTICFLIGKVILERKNCFEMVKKSVNTF